MKHQSKYPVRVILACSLYCHPAEQEPVNFSTNTLVNDPIAASDAGAPDQGVERNAEREVRREGCKPVPPNMVRNGAFEYQPTHACGWDTFDAADWGVIAAPYCVAHDHPSCAVYLASEVWGTHETAQFYQRVALIPHESHVLTFEAKAAGVARPLLVSVLIGGPLRNTSEGFDLGAGIEIELTTEWRTYVFPFITNGDAEDSILDFGIGGADTGLYLDNVSIISAATDESDP